MITDFYKQFIESFGVKEEKEEEKPYFDSGWICPKCGRVYSPSTSECWFCNSKYLGKSTNTSNYESESNITEGKELDIVGIDVKY